MWVGHIMGTDMGGAYIGNRCGYRVGHIGGTDVAVGGAVSFRSFLFHLTDCISLPNLHHVMFYSHSNFFPTIVKAVFY